MAAVTKASIALVAAIALPIVTAELPSGVLAVPLIRDPDQQAYYAELLVGTPPQKEYLKVDTGSPRYSVLNSRNEVCLRDSQPCAYFGTFDNTTSSTCRYEGPNFQDALGSYGIGDYLSDTIGLGGVSTKDMYFGYTSHYGNPSRVSGRVATIMGLSLDCIFGNPTCQGKGAYILPQLKNASTIDYMSTSFYLGPDDRNVPNAHMLMGNAYDKAKVDGEMFTVPMVDPNSQELSGGQTNTVNVTAIEVVLDDNNRTLETYGDKGVGSPVLLDTGIASWYMTETIFNAAFYGLGGRTLNLSNPYQTVDCSYRDPARTNNYVSVEFGSAGKIKIPLHNLVTQFEDGTCAAFIYPRGDVISTMGDPFLRSVYAIFDQESMSVSLGQVKYTDEKDIVRFPKGGFTSGRQ